MKNFNFFNSLSDENKKYLIDNSKYIELPNDFTLFSLKFNTLTTLIEDIKFKRLDTRILEYLKNKEQPIVEITHEKIANELDTSRVVIFHHKIYYGVYLLFHLIYIHLMHLRSYY